MEVRDQIALEHLKLDTELFGLNVSRILPETLTVSELKESLDILRAQKTKLVYWCSAKEMPPPLIDELGGGLYDEKVSFIIDPQKISLSSEWPKRVEEYPKSEPTPELYQLAVEAGWNTRFSRDPKISKENVEKMYHLWVKNLTLRKQALTTLVIREGDKIVAFSSLREKEGVGDFALLAVDEKFRGRGYGLNLTHASLIWFKEHGYDKVNATTQDSNPGALRIIENKNFAHHHTQYFYHFWL